jgi:DNA-directed RNA polymerase subunit L
MELKVVEESKNKLVIDVKGESHTLCNVLKRELWKDKNVKVSGYYVDHPLVGTPRFVVETDGGNPKDALLTAVKNVKKDCDAFIKVFEKEVK